MALRKSFIEPSSKLKKVYLQYWQEEPSLLLSSLPSKSTKRHNSLIVNVFICLHVCIHELLPYMCAHMSFFPDNWPKIESIPNVAMRSPVGQLTQAFLEVMHITGFLRQVSLLGIILVIFNIRIHTDMKIHGVEGPTLHRNLLCWPLPFTV